MGDTIVFVGKFGYMLVVYDDIIHVLGHQGMWIPYICGTHTNDKNDNVHILGHVGTMIMTLCICKGMWVV